MAGSSFGPAEARLVALSVESILYGIYIVTLANVLYVFFSDDQGNRKHRSMPLLIVTSLFAIITTLEIASNLYLNLLAFVLFKGTGGPNAVFTMISLWANVSITFCTQFTELITDAMLIYRCLVVFSYKWYIIVVPVILWLANFAVSMAIVIIAATLRTSALVYAMQLKPWITAFGSISLCSNALTTGLIVYRISRVKRKVSAVNIDSGGSGRAIRIIIESGLINFISVFITFVTVEVGSNALYVSADAGKMIHGITFNLIILRVSQGGALGGSSAWQPSGVSEPIPLRFGRASQFVSSHHTGRSMGVMVHTETIQDHPDSLKETKDEEFGVAQ